MLYNLQVWSVFSQKFVMMAPVALSLSEFLQRPTHRNTRYGGAFGRGDKTSGIQDHPWMHGELKASLGYIIPSLKKPEKKKKKPYTLIYKSIVTGMNLIPKCQGMGKCSQLLKIVFI